jgi:hypothetical protein
MTSKLPRVKGSIPPSNAANTEIRNLKPNDAIILMSLARHSQKSAIIRKKLWAILSDEGKLVAEALAKKDKGLKSKFPACVVSTANGLRKLGQETKSTQSKKRPKQSHIKFSSTSKKNMLEASLAK